MFWNSGMVTGGCLLRNNKDFHLMTVSPVSVIPLWHSFYRVVHGFV